MRRRWAEVCLLGGESVGVRHYCRGCKKIVEFQRKGAIRQNYQGKTLHAFENYFCPAGHHWKRGMKQSHGDSQDSIGKARFMGNAGGKMDWESLDCDVLVLAVRGEGTIRVDKALRQCFSGVSRKSIQQVIQAGHVLVRGIAAKPGTTVRNREELWINPEGMYHVLMKRFTNRRVNCK